MAGAALLWAHFVGTLTCLFLAFCGLLSAGLPLRRRPNGEQWRSSHSWKVVSQRPPGHSSWSCQLMVDPVRVEQLEPGQDSPDPLCRAAGGVGEAVCPLAFLPVPQKQRLGSSPQLLHV